MAEEENTEESRRAHAPDSDSFSASVYGHHLEGVARVSKRCVTDAGVDGAAVAIHTDDADARDLLYATNSEAARIDELQFTTGEGPCIDAFVTGVPQLHPNIGHRPDTTGWPSFASEVLQELGVHGVYAFPLFSGGARLGGLELYTQKSGTMTAQQITAAQAAASTLGDIVVSEVAARPDFFDESTLRPPDGPFRFARSDINIAVGVGRTSACVARRGNRAAACPCLRRCPLDLLPRVRHRPRRRLVLRRPGERVTSKPTAHRPRTSELTAPTTKEGRTCHPSLARINRRRHPTARPELAIREPKPVIS